MPTSDTLNPLPQGMLPLAPMEEGGPPARRLTKASDAQTIVANLWQASLDRNSRNASIQGQIDGNPPYNPALMRKAGRAGDANFNTLEAKALRSTAMVPYYDLFAGGNRYVEVKLDAGDDFQASYASGIVSEEYDRLLRRYRAFEFTMYGMMLDYVTFGKGYLTWGKNGSWRLQRVAHYRVLVPDATPVELDEAELVVVLQNWPVTYLQDAIRDKSAATARGWNIEETRNAIMSAVPADYTVPSDPMAAQAALRDSDIYVSARNSTVQAATLYVKEFSGKWSELIVRRDQIPTMGQGTSAQPSSDPTLDTPRFMFKRYAVHDNLYQCLCPFFFEPADANWAGASGLGRDIFAPMQLKDRISCTQADAVFLRNSLILSPRQETDRTKLQLMQLGKLTILPAGTEAQPATILGDIASTIEVSRELSTMLERNTGIYRPTLEKGGGNPDTLGEFQTKFAQATVLSSSSITRFYSQLDRLYEEQCRRVLDAGLQGSYDLENGYDDDASDWRREARRFVARCESRGVPREMLKRMEYIRAYRAIGQGSAAMRQQVVSTFLNPQVYPLFPPDGQQNILEDFTRTLGGQTAVGRYLPLSARLDLPTNDQWQAMQENAAMKIGAPVTWTPNQNNLIHAQFHLLAASQAAQSLQQGAQPADVLAYLDALGAHIAEHLQRESANPMSKAAVKALEQQWKRLATFADGLRRRLQQTADQQQELQEQQQEVLADADIKKLDVMLKNEVSRMKAEKTLELKAARQDAELALKAQQAAGANAQSDASTAADITRQTAKTQADIASAAAKTEAEIENQRRKAAAQAEAARNKPSTTS